MLPELVINGRMRYNSQRAQALAVHLERVRGFVVARLTCAACGYTFLSVNLYSRARVGASTSPLTITVADVTKHYADRHRRG